LDSKAIRKFYLKYFIKIDSPKIKENRENSFLNFDFKNTQDPVLGTGLRQYSEIPQKPFKVNAKSKTF